MKDEITMSRIIKQSVTFCREDFDTKKEWLEFCKKIKSDEEYMEDSFYENLDYDDVELIEDVKVED